MYRIKGGNNMEAIREFFTLTPYQLANVMIFLGLFALFTLVLSIFVTATSWKLFEKAGRNVGEAFIPVYNLVVLLQIAEIPSYYFFTLLVPGLNIILLIFVEYKLAKLFKVSKPFMWGMILCPIVFIPILAHGHFIYMELEEEEVYTDVSDEMPTVLSQEEIDAINREEIKENKVDNIFKSEIKQREQVPTYKSKEVNVNQVVNDLPEAKPEVIKRVEPVKAKDIEEAKKAKFVEEEKIEIVEL